MGEVLPPLPDVSKGTRAPSIRPARRLLDGSYRSVDDILGAARSLEAARRAKNESPTGRRAQSELDLLRASIVFASAGLDASMKRLVTDVGRVLVPAPITSAHKQFLEYLKQELSQPRVESGLRDAILTSDATTALLSHYLAVKTKASFQGSGDLKKRVLNLLGLPQASLGQKRIDSLDVFFDARNSIVHHMDYETVKSASMKRHSRQLETVVEQCTTALCTAAELINATAVVLKSARLV